MPNTSSQFTNPLVLSTLDGSIGVTLNGVAANDWSGSSIASAGDVNGDGIDDVLIGASGVGSSYLIFGHKGTWSSPLALGSLNGTNGVVITGGFSVASAGDVNGDGINDLVIGAYSASPGGFTNAGSSYLIFGHTGAWNSSLALSSLNGTNGVVINGIAANYLTGYSVASAGDVNGDGISDVMVGAPHGSPAGLTSAGSTYLIFGHTGTWSSPLALSGLNGITGVVINGIAAGDQSGNCVASAGDVNGDGIDDIVIAAPVASPGGLTNAGSTYLIFGHTGTWSSPLALGSLNGTNGVAINGIAVSDYSGTSVASAGDMNGDGISDVLTGAYGASPGGSYLAGSTYLIFGHTGTWSSPLALGSLNGINGVVINGIAVNDRSGVSVASAGDVNGDGINDVMIGADASPGGLTKVGSAYLILGHTGVWSSPLVLGSLNGINGVIINGIAAGDFSGNSVASAGDVNGDGLNDVLIGAYAASPGGFSNAGSTYLIFGDRLELLTNTLTINRGQTTVLKNSMLAATHPHNLAIDGSIPFKISNVAHGTFSTLNFLQSALSQNLVSFTHDGSPYVPSYEVTIGNWAIAGPEAARVSFDVLPNTNSDPTNTGTVAGSLVAVGILGLAFFGICWYSKKKTSNQFQKLLLEGTSEAEKAFNKEVVRPIASKIFEIIHTTRFFGQRSEADTKAYMMAIKKIILELRRQNANLDFNAMEPIDKELFINEIANQTRQQSLPKHKGFLGSSVRYFKAEATPQEIEYAAESIASAVVIWQSRHMGGVSAKSSSLNIDLGKLSGIGFSGKAENEGVPPEKQFKLMQNHLKAVEQRAEAEQEGKLEERLALPEAEQASFKRQSAVRSAS